MRIVDVLLRVESSESCVYLLEVGFYRWNVILVGYYVAVKIKGPISSGHGMSINKIQWVVINFDFAMNMKVLKIARFEVIIE